MTKLISGRVKKTPSANVSSTRYQFLKLEEAEPDLGLPSADGQALFSNTAGGRYWATVSSGGGGGGGTLDVANTLIANANVVLNTMSANSIVLNGFNGSSTLPRFGGNVGQVVVATGSNAAVWANKFYFGQNPPNIAFYGDIWYNTSEYKLYIWVTDGAGEYWFDFIPPTF